METVDLAAKRYFTKDQARAIATKLGIDFKALGCDLEQFRMGLGVELEHGPRDPKTDVSADDEIVTGKIALAHLRSSRTTTPAWPSWSAKPPTTRAGRSSAAVQRDHATWLVGLVIAGAAVNFF